MVLFEEFIPYGLAERFLSSILDYVQSPDIDLSVNLLLGIRGAGIGVEDKPIMLSLGVNLRTGVRCFFIDEDENPYEDQISMGCIDFGCHTKVFNLHPKLEGVT